MKRWLYNLAMWVLRRFQPKPDIASENRFLKEAVDKLIGNTLEEQRKAEYSERVGELIEARMMAGSGPWRVDATVLRDTDRLIDLAASQLNGGTGALPLKETAYKLREDNPILAQGATGDIELALANVEWRREINLSWLEFSRWGIQQIILISRLHYIKNPWIQRAINIVAAYVFGRGVEVMSEDDDANDVLQEFFERNKSTLGQVALANDQRRLQYDGQVFYAFFGDKVSTGKVTARTLDATEVFEIVTNPDDTDEPWFYHRKWMQKTFDESTGGYTKTAEAKEAYYPAISWTPKAAQKSQQAINGHPIMWDVPVLHFKGGTGIAKWHFDCPKAYAAIDWAKAGRKWLEACSTVRQSLAQIAWQLTTKGGQQALEGAKQALATTVGPTSSLWDKNPTAVAGATFASGPGTTLQAMNTTGMGGNPGEVAEYRTMVANVFEIPSTWLGDYTAILATATTLDRPTELGMLEKQERWREVLVTIAKYVLTVDQVAASGKLREAKKYRRKIVECDRKRLPNGKWVYEAKPKKGAPEILVKVNFPAIREGDMPANIGAIVNAMTLENKSGQVVGIDEKVGVGLLFEQLGVEDYGQIVDEMYPDPISGKPGRKGYDPDRTKVPIAPPIPKPQPIPGGSPQAPGGNPTVPPPTGPPGNVEPGMKPAPPNTTEAAARLLNAIQRVKEKRNNASSE